MTSTFAIDVIQALQTPELEDFKLFLASPYCTKGYNADAVKPFFEILQVAIEKGEIEKMEKEAVYRLLFPDRSFVESKIDKLMSDLKRLLERFILQQRYFSAQNEAQQLLDLTTEMRLRGLESRYQQVLDKAKKHADASGEESLKKFFFRYLLAVEEQNWQITYNKARGDLHIPQTIQHLDTYYFAHKTWMLNHLMVMQKATTLDLPLDPVETEPLEISQKALERSPFLSIAWDIYQLLTKDLPQDEDFYRLFSKLESSELELSEESLSEFYTYLRNLCVILIDAGNTNIYSVLHEINKGNLERGYFYINTKISPNAFLSISQTALSINAITWLVEFVEQHKDSILDENDTQDFYRMNKALCLFGEKKYQEALEIIPFGSTYSFYHLMARRLELKIYYELQSDLLDHKIDAFKMFISRAGRKVFSQNLHELFTNFVNFVRQLQQSNGPQAKQRSPVLVKRITEKKVVAERLWLLEKAKELGEKR